MLALGYIMLSILMVVILFLMGNHAISNSTEIQKNRTNQRLLLLGGLMAWQVYIYALGSSGFLADLSFPPRFVLWMILPAFLFTGIFLFQARKKQWIHSIPNHWLAGYQSFRIAIETLFVYTVAAGILHKNVTIEGYNMDLIFAVTAPIMTFLIIRFKNKYTTAFKIWNYIGLLVIASIIFLFQATIYKPELFGPATDPFPTAFGTYPYVLVAGFLMPSAVFVHVLSLVKLANANQHSNN